MPLTISFVNLSSGADTYLWDFGDGNTATDPDPSHAYGQSGTYTITLTVNGPGGGDTLTRERVITVYEPVTAEFSATLQSGTVPLTVTFTNLSSGADSYLWDFGDGNTSTEISPTHAYTQSGTYTVTLTAQNPAQQTSLTQSNYITVRPIPNWQLLSTATSPPVIGEGAMVYEQHRQQAVLYGGNATGWAYEATTWAFDGTDWTPIPTSQTPSVRYGMAMAYDPIGQQTILFGGNDASDTAHNQTWAFDGSEWTQIFPTTIPLSRTNASVTVDPETGLVYLFGGNDGATYFNDLWVYDSTNWQPIAPTGPAPPAHTLSAMAFDPATQQLILFGGRTVTGTLLSDLWSFDLANSTWQQPADTGQPPPARQAHTFNDDPLSQALILIGGSTENDDAFLGDMWAYQNGWTEILPATPLPEQAYHHAVVDPILQRLILFGDTEVWLYE